MIDETPVTNEEVEFARTHLRAGCETCVCAIDRVDECVIVDGVTPLRLIARIDELRAELEVVRLHYVELEALNFDITHKSEARIAKLEAVTGPVHAACGRRMVEHQGPHAIGNPTRPTQSAWVSCPGWNRGGFLLHEAPPEYTTWLESRK